VAISLSRASVHQTGSEPHYLSDYTTGTAPMPDRANLTELSIFSIFMAYKGGFHRIPERKANTANH
jgi:hypothetical protein